MNNKTTTSETALDQGAFVKLHVAYIDILGFSQKYPTRNVDQKLMDFLKGLHSVLLLTNQNSNGSLACSNQTHNLMISDCIFLFRSEIGILLEEIAEINFYSMLYLNLPTIAVIAYGEVFCDPRHDIYVGDPIIQAARAVEDKTIRSAGTYLPLELEKDCVSTMGMKPFNKDYLRAEQMVYLFDRLSDTEQKALSWQKKTLDTMILETIKYGRDHLDEGLFYLKYGPLMKELKSVSNKLQQDLADFLAENG